MSIKKRKKEKKNMTENNTSIHDAFAKSNTILSTSQGDISYINVSDIATILIQNVGRFCESYASDFLITWETVQSLINNKQLAVQDLTDKESTQDIIIFAIRKRGVDGNGYLINNLENYADTPGRITEYYRKILALEIKRYKNQIDPRTISVACTLKDITNNIRYVK